MVIKSNIWELSISSMSLLETNIRNNLSVKIVIIEPFGTFEKIILLKFSQADTTYIFSHLQRWILNTPTDCGPQYGAVIHGPKSMGPGLSGSSKCEVFKLSMDPWGTFLARKITIGVKCGFWWKCSLYGVIFSLYFSGNKIFSGLGVRSDETLFSGVFNSCFSDLLFEALFRDRRTGRLHCLSRPENFWQPGWK